MAKLTDSERASRRGLDYRLASSMEGNGVVQISAHENPSALARELPIDPEVGEMGGASCFLAEYRFPILKGASKTMGRARVVFNICGEAYPFTPPTVQVVSKPLPWSPHVHPGSGTVCIGQGWVNGRGRMLLVELIVHVARILNCDEPDRGPAYAGWNAQAVTYWRNVMNCAPLNPDLRYPVLPVEITHGVLPDERATMFSPIVDDGFAVSPVHSDGDFFPRAAWT